MSQKSQNIKPIETVYKGYKFRSRLEARWAVFFDEMEMKWEYEKEGFDLGNGNLYLPDFWLPFPPEEIYEYPNAGHWYEIKGQMPTDSELNKIIKLSQLTKHTSFIIVGLPGEHKSYFSHNKGNHGWHIWDESPWGGDDGVWNLILLFHQTLGQGKNKPDKWQNAINKSRQARFEHGEKP